MSTDIVVSGGNSVERAGAVNSVVQRVNTIHEILGKVMIEGTHYGTVPGAKGKVLFKPGAELLSMTFRLVPQFKVEVTRLDNGHKEYDVTCIMRSSDGSELGEGVGSGSTMEKKYRYVQGAERSDIADVYNTVLKMAKKRAFVDAVLLVTGASDMFTQDLIEEDDEPKQERKPIAQPKAKEPASDVLQVVGILQEVLTQDGVKDGKPWRKYGAKIDGLTYATFSETLAQDCEALKGAKVKATYTTSGKYFNLQKIEVAE